MALVPAFPLPPRNDRAFNPVVDRFFPRTLSALRPGVGAWLRASDLYLDLEDNTWLLGDTRLWPTPNAVANASVYNFGGGLQVAVPRDMPPPLREVPAQTDEVIRPYWVYAGPRSQGVLPRAQPLALPERPDPARVLIPAHDVFRCITGRDPEGFARRLTNASQEGWEFVETLCQEGNTDLIALMRRRSEAVIDDKQT